MSEAAKFPKEVVEAVARQIDDRWDSDARYFKTMPDGRVLTGYTYTWREEIEARARRILAAIPTAGFVLVPVEPSIGQIFAGQNAVAADVPASPGPVPIPMTTGSFGVIYRAMVAARPGAPQP